MKLSFAAAALTGSLLPAVALGQPSARLVTAKPESKQARYARLDQYAQHLPASQAITLEKLAVSLTAQARTDDDKARLIFTWLAYHIAYDATLSVGDTTHYYRRCMPEYVLQNRKAVCQGYADLFTDLATRMKLPARTITGYARTSADTGNLLSLGNGHGWNGYQIAGVWHLADATWGAGGTLNTNEFQQQFEPFWFDTPPAQFIFSHLPDSASWQLLPIPVTVAAYQTWPYVAPEWFSLASGEGMRKALPTSAKPANRLPLIKRGSYGVKLIQAPQSGELVANQPVKFVFSVPTGVEMSIVTDSSSVPLRVAGNYWQATITPVAGAIRVLVQRKDDFTTAINLLTYTIVPQPLRPRPASPGRAPSPTKEVYLRP